MSVDVSGMEAFEKSLADTIIRKQDAIRANSAAADVFIKHLQPNVPFDEGKSKGKHLRDMLTYKPGQYEDGSTDIGFTKDGYYFRFLNNGAKQMKNVPPGGLHFMEHTFDEAKDEMRATMARELRGGG
jgi:HK97 gp10 family phage protein